MSSKIRNIVVLLFLVISFHSWGQRIEIDRLERDFEGTFRDREAYELSQKFIQIDSTYYTGHYFEGLYRYFRASDQLGYQTAIKPLRKALFFLEKDFKRELRRTTDIRTYINTYEYQRKYALLVNLLARSNQYIGKPDKALEVLRKLTDKDFVFNFGVEPYATASWIYHRNRIYSPEKFPFLKGSIEENVLLASRYADSVLISNRKNRRFINQWFPNFRDNAAGSYFHFKNLINSYLLNVDSAEYYAQRQNRIDLLSQNNYGNLQFIQAKFEKAEEYYNLAREKDGYELKSTKEFDYMQSVINIFKNDLNRAQSIVKNSMDMLGPTPGFGWNNIAMTRASYYSGDLENAKKHLDKASNFKELHINSTWGKLHYDRNTLLFDYLYNQRKINSIKFSNKYYWLDVNDLKNIAVHYFKKENAQMLLTSDLSANPERFLVLYNIFSSENTIFFDEIWEVIKTFNSNYFIRLFEHKIGNDTREGILKYYRYFIAKFHLEENNNEQAISIFQQILEDKSLDPNYEKLLIARVYEGLAIAFDNLDRPDESGSFLVKLYNEYPQLVPFSPLKMKFGLQIQDTNLSEKQKDIIDQLESTNIEWLDDKGDTSWPIVSINFSKTDEKDVIEYSVDARREEKIEGAVRINDAESSGQELAYRLFSIVIN